MGLIPGSSPAFQMRATRKPEGGLPLPSWTRRAGEGVAWDRPKTKGERIQMLWNVGSVMWETSVNSDDLCVDGIFLLQTSINLPMSVEPVGSGLDVFRTPFCISIQGHSEIRITKSCKTLNLSPASPASPGLVLERGRAFQNP